MTPPAVRSALQDTAPGGGEQEGPLIPVDGPRSLVPDLNGLPYPALVFVVLGSDDSGFVSVHDVIFCLTMVGG